MIECPDCHLQFVDEKSFCPNCGQRSSGSPAEKERPWRLVSEYFETLWTLLTHPGTFFSKMPLKGGLSGPLTFALITHWLGSSLAFLWHLAIGAHIGNFFENFFKMANDVVEIESPARVSAWNQLLDARDHALHWFWGSGSVILDPFTTLLTILFTSSIVFLGSRILVTPGQKGHPQEINFELATRIVCFGMAPTILAGIPFFGWGLATFLTAIITIIGAKVVYRIGTGRAIIVGIFPKILFLAMIVGVVFIFAIAFAKFLAALF